MPVVQLNVIGQALSVSLLVNTRGLGMDVHSGLD